MNNELEVEGEFLKCVFEFFSHIFRVKLHYLNRALSDICINYFGVEYFLLAHVENVGVEFVRRKF